MMVEEHTRSSTDRVATVVFVEHNPVEAHGLRETVASRSDVWNALVVAEGADVIGLMKTTVIDAVVAGADVGLSTTADLLREVRRRSPRTARVAMFDPDDHEMLLEMIGVAHQCLSTSVDFTAIADLIERIRGAASDGQLGEPINTLIGHVDRLPSPPALFQKLAEIMATNDWSINQIANEISLDVALTGDILRLVNSPFFGTAEKVTSVARAINLLGIELIRFVVLGNKLYQSTSGSETWLDLDRLDQRSKSIARATRALALRDDAGADMAALAYLAGMVSEIGLLVMARVPDVAPAITQPLNTGCYPGVERAVFGGDRFEVGARLLHLWDFDDGVVRAIEQLSADEVAPDAGDLALHLRTARALVIDEGINAFDLENPIGTDPEVDAAVESARARVTAATLAPAG